VLSRLITLPKLWCCLHIGYDAKSGRLHHYFCSTTYSKGKDLCRLWDDAGPAPGLAELADYDSYALVIKALILTFLI